MTGTKRQALVAELEPGRRDGPASPEAAAASGRPTIARGSRRRENAGKTGSGLKVEAQVQTLVTALLTPVQNALGGLEAAATPLWAACSGMIAGTFMLNALELIATGFHQRLFD